MKKFKVGFYGLTHLGQVYSIIYAKKKIETIAYSDDEKIINLLKNNKTNITEPKLNYYIKKFKKNILYTSDLNKLKKCDLIFYSADTPIKNNKPDYNKVIKSIKKLLNVITNKKTEIVILNQVYPGFTDNINWNKKKLFYQVETLIFGKAVQRAEKPERLIVGSKTSKDLNKSKFLKILKKFSKNIINMDYKSAELTKISINLFLISSINTTNMISHTCEKIGASWKSIVPALKSDKRIGKYSYLEPSLSIGGTNLTRDVTAFHNLLPNEKNKHNKLLNVWNENNLLHKKWAYNIIDNINKKKKIYRILIFGLSYKENTNSIKNSISLEIIKKYKNIFFYLYDPIIKKGNFSKNIVFIDKINKVESYINKIDVLMILNKSEVFKSILNSSFLKKLNKKYVIDPYGLVKLNKNLKINHFIKGN